MKKTIILSIAFVSITFGTTLFINSSTKKQVLDITTANVEALSSTSIEFPNANTQDYIKGEGWCCGPGSGICSSRIPC
ncbi:MAG: hypothetical protein WCZ67_02220 [Bacteroidales bacterium]|jgi:hypothetical protein